jgi:hypothetical protein
LQEDIQAKQSEGLKYGRIMKVFEWVYKSLAEVLMRKAKFPEDDSGWNAEEKEQFRIYRQDVCDCIAYCFELRGWTMLNELIDTAELHLQTVESVCLQYFYLELCILEWTHVYTIG